MGLKVWQKIPKSLQLFFFEFTQKTKDYKKSIYFVTTMWKFAKKECWLVYDNSYCAPYDIPQFATNMRIKRGTLMMKWSKYLLHLPIYLNPILILFHFVTLKCLEFFFLNSYFLKSWSWYKQIKFMTCFFTCIWFWHLVDYKPKKKFVNSSNNEITSKLSSHTHTYINEIVASFRTKLKKKRKLKCLETIVNSIRKIIIVKALYYLG